MDEVAHSRGKERVELAGKGDGEGEVGVGTPQALALDEVRDRGSPSSRASVSVVSGVPLAMMDEAELPPREWPPAPCVGALSRRTNSPSSLSSNDCLSGVGTATAPAVTRALPFPFLSMGLEGSGEEEEVKSDLM